MSTLLSERHSLKPRKKRQAHAKIPYLDCGVKYVCFEHMRGSRGGGWTGGPNPPPLLVKSEVAIGFPRTTGTDPLEKQSDPSGPIES